MVYNFNEKWYCINQNLSSLKIIKFDLFVALLFKVSSIKITVSLNLTNVYVGDCDQCKIKMM